MIRPGEIVISISKEFTRAPAVVRLDWADGRPTEKQIAAASGALKDFTNKHGSYMVADRWERTNDTASEKVITDAGEWIKGTAAEIIAECRESLDAGYLEQIDDRLGREEPDEGMDRNAPDMGEDERLKEGETGGEGLDGLYTLIGEILNDIELFYDEPDGDGEKDKMTGKSNADMTDADGGDNPVDKDECGPVDVDDGDAADDDGDDCDIG